MSSSSIGLSEELSAYVQQVGVRDDDILRRLREITAKLPEGRMQICPEQGQLMTTLVRMLGVKRAIEIGTYTGYSALCTARGLQPGGELVAMDVSEQWTDIGKPFWKEAGVQELINLKIAPAAQSLRELLSDGWKGTVDFIFIDADKPSYDEYYELCLLLLRQGGALLFDNTLWGGTVADPTNTTESTVALRALNLKLHADPRVELAMIPIGDGLTIVVRR